LTQTGFREKKPASKVSFYYLVCYLHLVNEVLAKEFDEILIDTEPTLKVLGISSGCFRRVFLSSVSLSLAPFS